MKDIPVSPRIALLKRNQKVKRLRLLVLFTLLFISLVGATSYFSFNKKITINNIKITGSSIIDELDLELSVNTDLKGRYLGLYSRSNFIIYPHDKILNNLKIKFPRIENIIIKREGLNTLDINITERAGSYLYCGEKLPESKEEVGENCYFVNNDGYIFDEAPYFSGDIYIKYYTKTEGSTSSVMGSQMFNPERFHAIVRFTDGVNALGFKPAYLVFSPDGINNLYLQSKDSNQNPKIIFKEDNDLGVILDNFATAMKEKEFANEINSKYDTLSYIDLRFKNKVLYKFE